MIFTRRGIDIDKYPAVLAYLQSFREQLEPRPENWDNTLPWLGRKPGLYQWYEIQDAVDYFEEFDKPKILFPDITKKPRFSWAESGIYLGNTAYFIPAQSYELLGILSSRTIWFVISQISQPLGERAGSLIYRLFRQYIERLPIPPLTDVQRERIGGLAQQLTEVARRRYEVRRRTTHSILRDLAPTDGQLSQKLELWWELSFQQFRAELLKTFKRDIAPKERDEWEELLRERATQIRQLTAELVRLETLLNEAVYDAFSLDIAERQVIERETKYAYGEW